LNPPFFFPIFISFRPSIITLLPEIEDRKMTAPIRIGFIGLSSRGWAKIAHLPYLQDTTKFKIVAVCNTSVESAQRAIEAFKFDAKTKAYGDVEGWCSWFFSTMSFSCALIALSFYIVTAPPGIYFKHHRKDSLASRVSQADDRRTHARDQI
jgi:hypothetical protein